MRQEVRLYPGTPPESIFTSPIGSPIVIDTNTGLAYWLNGTTVEHLVGWGVVSAVSSTTGNVQLGETYFTLSVNATGLTITLPAASSALIGYTWTVVLNVDPGVVTITRAGSDTIILPTTDTSVSLYKKGDSLSFRCMTATSWGLV